MERSLQEEQSPIFQRLVDALIEATPEWWSTAELELVAQSDGLGSGLAQSISSAEHPRDLVVPTDGIMEAARELELASVRHGDAWRRCLFQIAQESTGHWRFAASFERDA